jgi:hypothetical protein
MIMSIYLKPLYQAQLKSKTRQIQKWSQPVIKQPSSIEINMLVIEQESAEQLKQIKETQQILNAFIPLNTPAPYENTNAFKELTRDPIETISADQMRQNQKVNADIFANSFQKNPANLYLLLILILIFILAIFVSGRTSFSLFLDDPFAAIEEAFNPTIQQEKITEVDHLEEKQAPTSLVTTQSGELVLENYKIDPEKGVYPFAVIQGKISNYSNRIHTHIQIEATLSNVPKNAKNKVLLYVHRISDDQIKQAKENSSQYLNLINLSKSPSEDKLAPSESIEFKTIFEIKPKVKVQSIKIAFSETEKPQ